MQKHHAHGFLVNAFELRECFQEEIVHIRAVVPDVN